MTEEAFQELARNWAGMIDRFMNTERDWAEDRLIGLESAIHRFVSIMSRCEPGFDGDRFYELTIDRPDYGKVPPSMKR